MPRSGTTLLDKLISAHQSALVWSQPLPLLYVELKRRFLASINLFDRASIRSFPLNDMIGAHYYSPRSFSQYLVTHPFDGLSYRKCLESMIDYAGRYTDLIFPSHLLSKDFVGTFFRFVDGYLREISGVAELRVHGSKETFCEEYIPAFLAKGAYVILIVRDPRDVTASLNHGRGLLMGGLRKPTLFNIRCWRKGVAFAAEYRGSHRFMALKYEDLVRRSETVMESVTSFLDLPPLDPEVLSQDLKDQSGAVWWSNSSYRARTRIDKASIGAFRRVLAQDEIQFIEACSFPEMRYLGYDTGMNGDWAELVMKGYREEESLQREALSDYVWSDERCTDEIRRLQDLRDGHFRPETFIFQRAFDALASRLVQSSGAKKP
jgi:hypothetical protein